MKLNYYISVIAGLLVTSFASSYLACQEYDDMYYSPKNNKPKTEAAEVKNDTLQKSNYEKYRESIENSEYETGTQGTMTQNNVQDSDHINTESAKQSGNSESGGYDQGDNGSQYNSDNSCCSDYGYSDFYSPGWGFSMGFGYPFGWEWSLFDAYPYYSHGWYGPYDPYYYGYDSYWGSPYYEGYIPGPNPRNPHVYYGPRRGRTVGPNPLYYRQTVSASARNARVIANSNKTARPSSDISRNSGTDVYNRRTVAGNQQNNRNDSRYVSPSNAASQRQGSDNRSITPADSRSTQERSVRETRTYAQPQNTQRRTNDNPSYYRPTQSNTGPTNNSYRRSSESSRTSTLSSPSNNTNRSYSSAPARSSSSYSAPSRSSGSSGSLRSSSGGSSSSSASHSSGSGSRR